MDGFWAVAWVMEVRSQWAMSAVLQPGTRDPGLAQLVLPDVGNLEFQECCSCSEGTAPTPCPSYQPGLNPVLEHWLLVEMSCSASFIADRSHSLLSGNLKVA